MHPIFLLTLYFAQFAILWVSTIAIIVPEIQKLLHIYSELSILYHKIEVAPKRPLIGWHTGGLLIVPTHLVPNYILKWFFVQSILAE